ncbi:hypothetical protein BO70DRAFT_8317 [Aspergillus heteromorphus CBS 117.55]|uniref:Uncharacterized protein n=1 Tax=Aspergillus heteromorphus CBS 117.55 TaxID=1448321 RepID=A0A317X1B8_9EURO|nr:uncharacterized protein BO70DRAFT_8317 [Aspergillus heteromorphus CBS 117.55]PWY92376.1 hypothetical protein BO70DRAFT_8317 [Aspergillus heteromorphus CBS 117.55]
MASEPNDRSNTPATSEPINGAGVDAIKPSTDEPSNQANGDSVLTNPGNATSPAEENKPTADAEAVDEAKPNEETKTDEQAPAPVTSDPKESATGDETEQPTVGDKRGHESTSEPANADKSNDKNTTEPTVKKQKTDADHAGVKQGTPAPTAAKGGIPDPATNGNKKGGRPKKAKEPVKRDIPTGGIGSRTRSRTKAAS